MPWCAAVIAPRFAPDLSARANQIRLEEIPIDNC